MKPNYFTLSLNPQCTNNENQCEVFLERLNSLYLSLRFTMEKESHSSIPGRNKTFGNRIGAAVSSSDIFGQLFQSSFIGILHLNFPAKISVPKISDDDTAA